MVKIGIQAWVCPGIFNFTNISLQDFGVLPTADYKVDGAPGESPQAMPFDKTLT
jgi:hypothetical protein